MKLEGEVIVSKELPVVFVAASKLDYVIDIAGLENFAAKGNRHKCTLTIPDTEAPPPYPGQSDISERPHSVETSTDSEAADGK